ncbi:MAG: GGDEF domain-containing protein [Rhizobiales bacterium]|nr:GGDEF domain-containing protein [Hyphomicrobiales bacterium]
MTICTIILAAGLLLRTYDDFITARRNLHDLSDYRLLLDAANLLSAERGPSNDVLGEPPTIGSAARERLARFRGASDAALERLADHADTEQAAERHVPPAILRGVRQQLIRARGEIDRLATVPLAERQVADIQGAIEGMFAVVDQLQPGISWKVQRLVERDARLAGPVMTGQMLGDLREYGGRIASQIMAPIAARQPLALNNLIDFSRTRGRLLQLWQLIGRQDDFATDDPRLAAIRRDAERQFFGDGLTILVGLVQEGRGSGNYSMTPAELTALFVPTLQPLEKLRGGFLDMTIERVTTDRDRALRILAAAAGLTLAILAILAGLIVSAQRFVFRPLLQARNMVIALADDRDVAPSAAASRAREMTRLFDAIAVLRGKLRERAALTEQLKLLAETDGLTGLLNRGALERIGETDAMHRGLAGEVCMILMDIDHFKQVNDQHGHLVGDQVLIAVADLVRSIVGPADIVARFGGEEIAIVVPGHDIKAAIDLAKRMRLILQQHEMIVTNGKRLCVTASFGVARGIRGGHAWHHLIEAADDALYRAKSDGRNRVRWTPPVLLAAMPQAAGLSSPAEQPPRGARL